MTEYDRDIYWYWFVNIRGTGTRNQRKLLERFGHPSLLYEASLRESPLILEDGREFPPEGAGGLRLAEEGLRRLGEEGVRFIHWESDEYPHRFRSLYDPPYGFYLKGNLPDPARPAAAIVGTRNPTVYGRGMAAAFASALAAAGIAIISGMAGGVDAVAHKACLDAGGQTLGILGGGIDSMYPRCNWDLYLDMYRQGGIMSEYNLGVANKPGFFPMRNRLISGMADAVLVVEAGEKSGSLITADQGMEQGRDIYAVPGRVRDRMSRGCNRLIAQGAYLADSPEEMIRSLYSSCSLCPEDGSPLSTEGDLPENYPNLSADCRKILDTLDESDPVSFSDLLYRTGLGFSSLQSCLVDMEMSSLIIQVRQNLYVKKAIGKLM